MHARKPPESHAAAAAIAVKVQSLTSRHEMTGDGEIVKVGENGFTASHRLSLCRRRGSDDGYFCVYLAHSMIKRRKIVKHETQVMDESRFPASGPGMQSESSEKGSPS